MNNDKCCSCPESLAMATVPKQEWCEPYDFETALMEGTIFPCLNMPFFKADKGESNLKTTALSGTPAEADREAKMIELSKISFAINDLTLYLDTHPDCKEGLTLFKELLNKRLDLLAEFAGKFYPLTQISMITGKPDSCCYDWGEGPMPWEGGNI